MLPIASKLYALPPHESCFISSRISLETSHLTVVSFKDGHAQDNDNDRIRNYFLLLKNLGYIHGYSVCLWLRIIPKPMSIFNTNLKLKRWSLHAPSNPELRARNVSKWRCTTHVRATVLLRNLCTIQSLLSWLTLNFHSIRITIISIRILISVVGRDQKNDDV